MAGQWDVRITAPNGAEGHFVMDADKPDHAIIKEITRHMDTLRGNDPDPLAGIENTPPLVQPQRQARKQR